MKLLVVVCVDWLCGVRLDRWNVLSVIFFSWLILFVGLGFLGFWILYIVVYILDLIVYIFFLILWFLLIVIKIIYLINIIFGEGEYKLL